MHTSPRHASLNYSVSLPASLSTEKPGPPVCSGPHDLALNLVRDTYLNFLLDAEDMRAATPLSRRAALALDRATPEIERGIGKLCAEVPLPRANDLQQRLDDKALAAFGQAIKAREHAAQQISIDPDLVIRSLRANGLPTAHILPDAAVALAMQGAFLDKLKRALSQIMFPAEAPPQGLHRADEAQISAALARIEPTRIGWQDTLTRRLLNPVAALTQTHAQQEYAHTESIVSQWVGLAPAALAARLDALDVCTEDGLAYMSARAVVDEADGRMGMRLDNWAELCAHLETRELSTLKPGPRLDDLAQAMNTSQLQASKANSVLGAILMPAPLAALIKRSIASSLWVGAAGEQAAVSEAMARVSRANPLLNAHFERMATYLPQLETSFPRVYTALQALAAVLAEKGFRTDSTIESISRHVEGAICKTVAGMDQAAPLRVIEQLHRECRKLLETDGNIWRGVAGQSWLNALRSKSLMLARQTRALAADLTTLGIPANLALHNQLVRAAMMDQAEAAVTTREGFHAWARNEPQAVKDLREALLAPNGKFRDAVRQHLNEMKRDANPARERLALNVERVAARLRASTTNPERQAARERQNDEARLLDEAIRDAQAAREGGQTERTQRAVEYSTELFLSKMPKGGSIAKRHAAVTHYLKSLKPGDLFDLVMHVHNRLLYRQNQGHTGPYRKRLAVEEDMLARILPALAELDRQSSERLTMKDMHSRFMSQHIKDSGVPLEAARRIANRVIMSTERLVDIAVSIRGSFGPQDERDKNIWNACAEARLAYLALEDQMAGLGEVGAVIKTIWGQTLDHYADSMLPSAPLSQALANSPLIYPLGDRVAAAALSDNHELILREMDKEDIQEQIARLSETASNQLTVQIQASAAHHALVFACATVTEYHRAQRAGINPR